MGFIHNATSTHFSDSRTPSDHMYLDKIDLYCHFWMPPSSPSD